MKIRLMFLVGVFLCVNAYAGVWEHFVYSSYDRYQLDKLDALAVVKITKFYVFADCGLVETLLEEIERREEIPNGADVNYKHSMGLYGGGRVYNRIPAINATLQLSRNSLWLFEVEILEELDGNIGTNRVFVAARPTQATRGAREHPEYMIQLSEDAKIVFGLVRVEDDEFRNSFQGLTCYINNDPFFFKRPRFLDPVDGHVLKEDYQDFFIGKDFCPSPCYVAREIGVQSGDGTKKRDTTMVLPSESELIRVFREERKGGITPR